MFALVKEDQVIKVLKPGQTYVDVDSGVQHPGDIFRKWSRDELKNIGIYEIVQERMEFDPKTEYEIGAEGYIINDDVVTMSRAKKDKNIDMVKENEIKSVKNRQYQLLNHTDWYYIRKVDKDIDIPANVQDYRNEVRIAGDKMIEAIHGVIDKEGFQSLYPVLVSETSGKELINTGGILHMWPNTKDYSL